MKKPHSGMQIWHTGDVCELLLLLLWALLLWCSGAVSALSGAAAAALRGHKGKGLVAHQARQAAAGEPGVDAVPEILHVCAIQEAHRLPHADPCGVEFTTNLRFLGMHERHSRCGDAAVSIGRWEKRLSARELEERGAGGQGRRSGSPRR